MIISSNKCNDKCSILNVPFAIFFVTKGTINIDNGLVSEKKIFPKYERERFSTINFFLLVFVKFATNNRPNRRFLGQKKENVGKAGVPRSTSETGDE